MKLAKEIAESWCYDDMEKEGLEALIAEKLEPVRKALYLVLNCGGWYYSALEIDVYGHGYNGENIEKELKSALAMLSDECEHEWVDASNEVVSGAEVCVKCRAVRAMLSEEK